LKPYTKNYLKMGKQPLQMRSWSRSVQNKGDPHPNPG
jgi:hypothetical protein